MAEPTPEATPRFRVPLPLLLGPILLAMVSSFVADIVGPGLINERPLLQVFLNPRNRYLLLAAPQVAALPFFVIGFFRLVLTDPLSYVLGRQHGDAALRWLERRSDDDGAVVQTILRWFAKAAPVIVFIAPNLYICALSGASRMRPRVFIPLNLMGTVTRLLLFRAAGEAFSDQLLDALELIQRYQWPLIAVSFVVVSFQVGRAKRSGRLTSLSKMEAELQAEEDG